MNREATGLAGVRHETYEVLGSTNAEALARARAGERGPLWITALSQSAGHGRRGRTWVSEPGNLYASLLLTDPAPAELAPQLSFVAALAVRDAIAVETPALAPRLTFKWPNDVLLGAEKVAGILIEGEVTRGEPATVVIGIGINCASHPPDASFPATDLRAHGSAATPQSLIGALSAAMLTRIAQWDRGEGFAAIRRDWLAAAHGIGEAIRVNDRASEWIGRFAGLDESGRLLLDLPDGTREEISTGDMFPLTLRAGRQDPLPRG
jgi:BirA family biotin operon repressor/biotin-[acetyl-CoA-carboxylase] ligase